MNAAAPTPDALEPQGPVPASAAPLRAPLSIEDSGLPRTLLEDIVARQLFESGVADLTSLSSRTALMTRLLEQVLQLLRGDGRIEVRGPDGDGGGLRYTLTDAGRAFAREARERSGYVGPAPISVERYRELIASQSVHDLEVSRDAMRDAFDGVVIEPLLLDRLGAAMHSGKAIFIHGPAGTGKTFICSRLIRLLRTPVHIPHAIVVGDSIVRVFDAAVHRPVEDAGSPSAWVAERTDPRLILCERPFVVSGGELTMDLLEVRHDPSTRQYFAPLQLKATHGIYMIDDLGRQRMSTDALFNRWIVPMESGIDYLNLDSGARLIVPFDVVLIFSTNMRPEDLDDPAFQRRIGHKIGFDHATPESYTAIWRQECERRGVAFDPAPVGHAIDVLHGRSGRSMLACHPRDLIGMSLDYSRYAGEPGRIGIDALELAWSNYFATSAEPDVAL